VTETRPTAAVVRRLLPAPPDVVYDEWLDPDALAEWMCPRPARPTRITLNPEIGGALRIDIEESGLVFYVVGRFISLDRPRRLSFSWYCSTWDDPTLDSTVTVTLEPHGDEQTVMIIHHELLPAGLVEEHETGWAQISVQLQNRLRALSESGDTT
jgi:uncharacterized protein YndB with AHSA1/START domain